MVCRAFAPFFFSVCALFGIASWSQHRDGLRGSGEVIEAYTPTDQAQLERLFQFIRPDGFDIDRVHQVSDSTEVRHAMIELAGEILRHFPPSDYDYVSLGRSAAAVAVILEEILRARGSGASVHELPLSGLRHDMFEAEWYRENLREHFRRFFPEARGSEGRKVLVLDYVQKGGTLNKFASILELGEREGWISRETHVLGLLNPAVDPRALWLATFSQTSGRFPQSRWHSLKLPQSLWPYFFYSSWKHLAIYEGWEFRDRMYEENVKSDRWRGTSMPGSGRRDRRPLPEPRLTAPRRTEQRPLWRKVQFWSSPKTEREIFADEIRDLLRTEDLFRPAIRICGRVHRAD